MVRHDIETIEILFSTIQGIHMKGLVGPYGDEGAPKEWITMEDVHRNMPRPKLKKDEIRHFLEYQSKRGNLDIRTGKDKFVRQAEAEYKVSRDGLKIIATFNGMGNLRDMYGWSRQMTKKSDAEAPKEDTKSDED